MGHSSATCSEKVKKKINTCLKLSVSDPPRTVSFYTRQSRKVAHHTGLGIVSEPAEDFEKPVPLLPLPPVSNKTQ